MYGEHIEAMLELFRENGMVATPHEVAEEVVEILFAQGTVDRDGCDELVKQLESQVEYLMTPAELKRAGAKAVR